MFRNFRSTEIPVMFMVGAVLANLAFFAVVITMVAVAARWVLGAL